MYCLTRYEMKFGDVVIPARTKCTVINKITTDTVNALGVDVRLAVDNYSIKKKNTENENKVTEYHRNINDSALIGMTVSTSTTAVYMDAGDELYRYKGIYDWSLERIFGRDKVPEQLFLGKHKYNGCDARLRDVIDYLENEFNEWIMNNCEFYSLTEDDIENGEGLGGSEPGDQILSENGLEQFYKKKLEYQNKLETIGFTYDFTGGLIWE